MSEMYEKAKQVAQELVREEEIRKEHADKVKALKEELMDIIENNSIESYFEFSNGVVELVEKESFVIPDGLKEEAQVKINKVDEDLVQAYFKGDVKLNSAGKKAIMNSLNPELSSLVDVEVKRSIKVTLG